MRRGCLFDAAGRLLVPRLLMARSPWDRFRGLMGRRSLSDDEGLWLPRCRSVHTCFMRFAIDIAFVDGSGYIVGLAVPLRPWRCAWNRKAAHTLELPIGGVERLGLAAGMALRLPVYSNSH